MYVVCGFFILDGSGSANISSASFSTTHVAVEESLLTLPTGKKISRLQAAVMEGHEQCLNDFLARDSSAIDFLDEEGRSAVHYACFYDQMGCLDILLKYGASAVIRDKKGWLPLHVAVDVNATRLFEKFILKPLSSAYSSQTSISSKDLHIAAGIAAEKGHIRALKFFLSLDAVKKMINDPLATRERMTLLHKAAISGNIRCIQEILDNGAKVDSVDERGETAVHIAAMNGHCIILQILIEHGNRVARRGQHASVQAKGGLRPLHYAAREGHVDCLKLLLSMDDDLDINARTENYDRFKRSQSAFSVSSQAYNGPLFSATPLHFAVYYGHLEAAECLLAQGADHSIIGEKFVFSEQKCINGTAIELAEDRSFQAMQVLVPLSIDVRLDNELARSALRKLTIFCSAKTADASVKHLRNILGELRMRRYLLQSNLGNTLLNQTDNYDAYYPLSPDIEPLLAYRKHADKIEDIIDHLISVKGTSWDMLYGRSILHYASAKGTAHSVKKCIDHAFSIEAQDIDKWRPLHVAVAQGNYETARAMLENSAEVNARTRNGDTPAQLAVKNGDHALLHLLLSQIEVTRSPNSLRELLQTAAEKNLVECARICIQFGAPIEAPDAQGWRALHTAAWAGSLEVVELLLEQSAIINARTTQGETALQLAARQRNSNMISLLLENNAEVSGDNLPDRMLMHIAAQRMSVRCIKLCLKKNISAHSADIRGWYPLHEASFSGNLETVAILLTCKNDVLVNQQTPEGYTALFLAAKIGAYDIMCSLLADGADPSLKTLDGRTILHAAAEGRSLLCVQLCVERGLSLKDRDIQGWQPLHIAAYWGSEEIVRYMLGMKVDENMATAAGETPQTIAKARGNFRAAKLLQATNKSSSESSEINETSSVSKFLKEQTSSSTSSEIVSAPAATSSSMEDSHCFSSDYLCCGTRNTRMLSLRKLGSTSNAVTISDTPFGNLIFSNILSQDIQLTRYVVQVILDRFIRGIPYTEGPLAGLFGNFIENVVEYLFRVKKLEFSLRGFNPTMLEREADQVRAFIRETLRIRNLDLTRHKL